MSDFIFDNFGWVVLVAIIAVIAGVFALAARDCHVYSRVTGVETRFEFGTCYVKQGDRFYPREEIQLRNATKGE
ncbi:hypothetical protein J5H43_01825 [Stenotrophomonas maltophilia]|uniref:hypothetical protein n=1 Tax=Stenotrophomonas maltophilia TaxID=40324 RepID=UPI001AAFE99C|nr:hypothetical protein [Stenotrophomonas maltophilia]MBO3002252.1 hypothetical protein [Stenotrophomonas maltophilia]MBP1381604.1 hypothetical protein [Stenotrophomonas maltophilia]MBP1386616.1 hypothetical protein [Stenotrophomonas maltophilia]